jgi:DNA-binding response OmpR family regulator
MNPYNRDSYTEEPETAQAGHATNLSRRILVVEDDENIRELNALVLTGSGYDVDAVVDGAAGWEALNAKRYDLLITDHDMPKLTGVQLINKLHAAHMAVPVILASGVVPPDVLNLPLAATLWKPFTLGMLLGTVQEVFRGTNGVYEQTTLSQTFPSQPELMAIVCEESAPRAERAL